MTTTATHISAGSTNQPKQYAAYDEEAQEQRRRERDARIAKACSMFLFPTPSGVEKILETYEARQPWNALAIGGIMAKHLKTFPPRHTRNLEGVLRSKHPAWSEKLGKLQTTILRPDGCIVALIGGRGTGKTQLATALARFAAEQAVCVHPLLQTSQVALYASLPDLLIRVRATYAGKRGGDTEAAIIGELSRCRLLILDEIHEACGTDWASGFLTSLVDRRYREPLDTILISNEQPEAFARTVGASVADRLRECGGFVTCNWPSFRGDQP